MELIPVQALGITLLNSLESRLKSTIFLVHLSAYVANRVTDKLTKITDYIYCCRSGSAADTQAIADIVNYHLEFHE